MRIVLVAFTALVIASTNSRGSAATPEPPCVTAVSACTEWVTLGGGPARSLIYRTYPLAGTNANIRRALVMVHGTNRNADHYFTTAATAAFLAGALQDTVVIAPRIASNAGSCKDALALNEVSWSCTGDSWRSGGAAVSHPALSSPTSRPLSSPATRRAGSSWRAIR